MNYLKYSKIILTAVFLFTVSNTFSQSKFKVTLDAGHGDHDFGAVYNGHIEKKIALAVVLKVGKLLEKNPNIEVIYTRKGDQFIDLVERANIANRADSNIFVSIHCNANKNAAAEGCETYVMGLNKSASNLEAAKRENSVITLEKDYKAKYEGYDPKSPESMIGITMMGEEYLNNSIALAGSIQEHFLNDGRKGRGVKQAPFMVLHKAYMPRVLIEMGFISNPREGAMLDSEDGQNQTAEAIANAIIAYKKEYFGANDNDVMIKPSQRVDPVKTTIDTSSTPKPVVKTPEVKELPKQEIIVNGTIFKIQLSASTKRLEPIPSNFKGLNKISIASDGGQLFKYMYGETSSYDEARKLLSEAKAKGFEGAYIIAFKDGKRVSVQDALKK